MTGRWLGERLLPDSSPISQLGVGLLALLLPLLLLLGVPVLLIAAPVGFGAWLTATRPKPGV